MAFLKEIVMVKKIFFVIIIFLVVLLLITYVIKEKPSSSEKDAVKLAILDSGINKDLDVFNFNIVKTFNTFDSTSNVQDDYGHGTAVTSIISDFPKKENLEIYDVKVLDEKGFGDVENLVLGIEWAIEQSVDIINISLGVHQDSPMLKTVINRALKEDIIIVASSGNNYGLYIDYPARYKGVISVSSLKSNNEKVYKSELGKIEFVDYGIKVKGTNVHGEIDYFSGTSFATATVTKKIVNLILSNEISKSNESVLKDLHTFTTDLGEQGKDEKFGFGILNYIE